jgi:membrane-associated phospholipid phosphatase
MNVFLNYLKNGKTFLITSVLFLFFSLITLLLINPSSTPVYSKLIHHVWMNIFFINLTFMGDSFFIILMVVFIIFYLQKTRLGLKLLLGLMITTFFVQLLNQIFIVDSFQFYVENGQYLFGNSIKSNLSINTVISSHTAIAFTWATILSIKIKEIKYQKLFFFLSIFVAFSRLYLAPHQFFHLIIGAGVGLLSGLLVYLFQINFISALKKSTRLLKLNSDIADRYNIFQIR